MTRCNGGSQQWSYTYLKLSDSPVIALYLSSCPSSNDSLIHGFSKIFQKYSPDYMPERPAFIGSEDECRKTLTFKYSFRLTRDTHLMQQFIYYYK